MVQVDFVIEWLVVNLYKDMHIEPMVLLNVTDVKLFLPYCISR